LHALITNAALHYSPDQVEFYLIDFKKGVEFKTYATHRLPHARVIAIESEREFGLSVLERLDGELRRRGELYRVAGVQDLAGYRAARPGEPMPRVLLVIDEFQELFIEDDKLSQDAALLLDRLVRQGRAFGIHVILGSQTLSGAYSLARSTMGQMAIRVALQCSEADAHVILSDERNMAARYLSRPGEAIYNDQNGLLAGNQPFQVVWLSESKRVEYLRQVEDFAAAQGMHTPPAIVFEGDQPADPAENGSAHRWRRQRARSGRSEGKLGGRH
jgi:DNA segregation ATPase FtsK/SpoIIIE-like protein